MPGAAVRAGPRPSDCAGQGRGRARQAASYTPAGCCTACQDAGCGAELELWQGSYCLSAAAVH